MLICSIVLGFYREEEREREGERGEGEGAFDEVLMLGHRNW